MNIARNILVLFKLFNYLFIYFFAFVDLLFGILTNVLALGDPPLLIQPFMGVITAILTNPFFSILE